jgi:diadenosine tetraphosphatase ApaH/serine/threonine PP2A family protein phosphatase
VLDDIEGRGIEGVLNLGDSLYGPIDPSGTADIIMARKIVSILGNEDRIILESLGEDGGNTTLSYTLSRLSDEHLDWLWCLPQEMQIGDDLYLCHGTPSDDTEYLLKEVGEDGIRERRPEKILERLEGIESHVILCGHDHIQADLRLPGGRLVVDPGSVGLPAYKDDLPFPHRMESGSPHARYSILRGTGGCWEIERRSVEYDWESASRMATENGRPDWANWLLTGRAVQAGSADS